jgi:lysophospholipase L1-like esterase
MNDAFTGFGVNGNTDTVDASPPITLARAKSNLQSMISSIKAANPFSEVILMTMDVAYDTTANPITRRPDLASYYQVYRDVAAEQHLLLIDNYVSWKSIYDSDLNTYKTYVPDGVHPTAAASTLITFNNVKTALTAVPEPSSSGLLATAALAALILGRRSLAVWRKGFQCYRLPPR